MRAKPEYFREQARRSRELAARSRDKDIKTHLLDVAKQYDKLAEQAVRDRSRSSD